ncbi:MAG: long-chain fatty acid--CoA ligase [Bacteroidota bacterium]|nr:long-chain fatty acid--CoA ligase [Bacteroidota bacterium]
MEPTRLFDLLPRYAKQYNKPDMLAAKENGVWKTYSSDEVTEDANLISYALFEMGLQKGDKITIISNNRPEWVMVNMGMMEAGCINVPIYPTISLNDLIFILNNAEVKYVFVSDQHLYDKVKEATQQVPGVKKIFSFDPLPGVTHWSTLLESGKNFPDKARLNAVKDSIQTNDVATIIYTSGTTGNPKGVMLSHHNLLSNAIAQIHAIEWRDDYRVLSFLPLNHVFERMLTVLYIYKGLSIYYAESLEKISDNLKEVKPHCFATVPRLLEKVFEKIVAKGNEQKGIKKILFFWALNLGLRYELNGANGWWYEFQLKIANKLIFSKWREALGGNIIAIISGGAALQPRLARVFNAARIPVLEGYGLTETSPVIAVNTKQPNSMRFGTVGPIIKDVEVKINEDGEILVKGPNVMLGYYKNSAETNKTIIDGWLHTGDIGEMVEGRFLKITDRKKEIFKTSGGKYIAPQPIENALKQSMFIEQVMVVGESQKFPGALIVPAFLHLKSWCKIHNIPYTSDADIINNKQVQQRIWREVEKVNLSLSHFEMVKKIALVDREWTIDKNELTPKLSLRRKLIAQNFSKQIAEIYS